MRNWFLKWLMFRVIPPLLLAVGVYFLRSGEGFMDTFTASIWIGFLLHAAGWFKLRHARLIDVLAFFPLLLFYGRVADIAWSGNWSNPLWLFVAGSAYGVYLVMTFFVWITQDTKRSA